MPGMADEFGSYEETLLAHDNNGYLIRYDALDPAYQGIFDQTVRVWVDDYDPPEGKWDEPDALTRARALSVPRAVPLTDSQGVPKLDAEGRVIPRPTTVYDVVVRKYRRRGKVPVPVLCHQEHLDPVGVCRMCVVKVSIIKRGNRRWERKLLPACQLRIDDNMVIHTASAMKAEHRDEIRRAVQTLTGLLAADHLPDGPRDGGRPRRIALPVEKVSNDQPFNELARLAHDFQVKETPFASGRPQRVQCETHSTRDTTSDLVRVDHDQCILCDRCVRACDIVKENLVIGRAGKGYNARIAFDLDDAMGRSSCVACGECMLTCPTGALTLLKGGQRTEEHKPPRRPGYEEDLVKRLRPVKDPKTGELRCQHKGEIPTPAELQPTGDPYNHPAALGLFRRLPLKQLEWFLEYHSIVRRRVSPGDLLCVEGEYGSEAFILLAGKFDILVPIRATDANDAENALEVPLTLAQAAARAKSVTLSAADLLIVGEMSCLNNQKRAATIRVSEEGEVLEVRRNVLYYLQRHPESRETLRAMYFKRALANLIKEFVLFRALDDHDRNKCAAILARADAGEFDMEGVIPKDDPSIADIDLNKELPRETFAQLSLDAMGGTTDESMRRLMVRGNAFAESVRGLADQVVRDVGRRGMAGGDRGASLRKIVERTATIAIGLDNRITLLTAEPGQLLIRQGEDAREIYLIRVGHVKVAVRGEDGGERVLAHLKPGTRSQQIGIVGEIALLTKILRYWRWSRRLDDRAWAKFGLLAQLMERGPGGRPIEPEPDESGHFPPGWDMAAWATLCANLRTDEARDDLAYLARQFPRPDRWADLKKLFTRPEWAGFGQELDRRGLMRESEWGKRTANCYALDHVELVRIPEKVFLSLMSEVPALFDSFRQRTTELLAFRGKPDVLPGLLEGQFLRQGLYNAQKMFLFDLTRCTRCDECTRACADSHGDGISRLLREGLRLGDYLVGTSCRSCTDPYCMDGCPVDSIHREGKTLNIKIESHCIGCGLCARNCPYSSIQMVPGSADHRLSGPPSAEGLTTPGAGRPRPGGSAVPHELAVAQVKEWVAKTCDLCEGLIKPGEKTYCVYACPHDAAHRVNGDQLMEMVQKRLKQGAASGK